MIPPLSGHLPFELLRARQRRMAQDLEAIERRRRTAACEIVAVGSGVLILESYLSAIPPRRADKPGEVERIFPVQDPENRTINEKGV
jgi:hypothetical protein